MKIPRVFQPVPLSKGLLSLDAKAIQHVAHALRMKSGDSIEIFNGQGGAWVGSIRSSEKRKVEVELLHFNPDDASSSLKIHLAQAVSKGPRMDYVMQKATELGVHAIIPVISERCEVKLDESRWQKKIEGWQAHVYSACEQCGLNTPPIVSAPATLSEWVARQHPFTTCLVLHPGAGSSVNLHTECSSLSTHVGLIIGPEGGFSESEIQLLLDHGVKTVSLGPRIFRTETAPIVAIALLQYLSGNLS